MKTDRKFTFDACFSNPDADGNTELYDVKTAREKGEKDGYDKGYQVGYSESARKLEKLLNHILKEMEVLNEKFSSAHKTINEEVLQISFAMVQKLFPYFMKQGGFDEIQQVVEKALKERDDEKAYTIYVNGGTLEPLKNKVIEIDPIPLEEGRVMLKEDNTLTDTDCRIEWKSGGLERIVERLNREIQTAVARLVPEAQLNPPLPSEIDATGGESHSTNIETK